MDAGTGGGSMGGGNVQFRSYPAAACVQSFSHSINGVTVETVSDVQETAAFLNRTGMSYEYARTAGNSLYRLAGEDGKRNSGSVSPGGALQPWSVQATPEPSFAVPCSRRRVSSVCQGVYPVDATASC